MLGLSAWELAMVLVVALVVLGPDKIPEVARKLARLVGQLRRMTDDVRRNIDEALAEEDRAKTPPQPAFTAWLEEQQRRNREAAAAEPVDETVKTTETTEPKDAQAAGVSDGSPVVQPVDAGGAAPVVQHSAAGGAAPTAAAAAAAGAAYPTEEPTAAKKRIAPVPMSDAYKPTPPAASVPPAEQKDADHGRD